MGEYGGRLKWLNFVWSSIQEQQGGCAGLVREPWTLDQRQSYTLSAIKAWSSGCYQAVNLSKDCCFDSQTTKPLTRRKHGAT